MPKSSNTGCYPHRSCSDNITLLRDRFYMAWCTCTTGKLYTEVSALTLPLIGLMLRGDLSSSDAQLE